MCLSKFWEAPPEMREGEGWKVGRIKRPIDTYDDNVAWFETADRREWLDVNVWVNKSGTPTIVVYQSSPQEVLTYRSGFHIFLTEEAAKSWMHSGAKLIKVKYRKGHTMGVQKMMTSSPDYADLPVIVADEIFIGVDEAAAEVRAS